MNPAIAVLPPADEPPFNTNAEAKAPGALQAVLATILAHQRFLVTSHARPDGDAVGSSLACAEMLRYLGKDCELILADPVPQVYATLPGVEQIQQSRVVDAGRYDVAIVLECDGLERTGLSGLEAMQIVNVDHHMTGSHCGALNWIDDSVAAVAVLVFHLANALSVPISPAMATCLYTALFTDTGAFTYPGTANSAMPIAQELIQCGADADRVARDVLYSVSTAHIRLLGTALSRLQIEGVTAWSYTTQQDLSTFGATDEDSEGTVDYLISIAGVDAALFLRELPMEEEKPGQFRVSLRSKTGLDVSSVAASMGGGGHQRAAGCTVSGPLESAVQNLLAKVDRNRGTTLAS